MSKSTSEIVCIQECASGNGEVGHMWHETKIFNKRASLADVLEWTDEVANSDQINRGRLIITVPHEV
jgi:protease II